MAPRIFEKFTFVPREKIFEVVTDHESHQKLLPEIFPSVRIISVRPNTTLVEMHLNLFGKEFVVMAKHLTEYPLNHEIFFVCGDAKGTHIIEKYEESNSGTKITLSVDFKYKGKMRISGILGKGEIETDFSKILDNFIKIAEN